MRTGKRKGEDGRYVRCSRNGNSQWGGPSEAELGGRNGSTERSKDKTVAEKKCVQGGGKKGARLHRFTANWEPRKGAPESISLGGFVSGEKKKRGTSLERRRC